MEALKAVAIGNIRKSKMNIEIYLKSSVGIGEHPDLASAIDSQVTLLADAEDKLATLIKHFAHKM